MSENIAILLTCFNRKDLTLLCLERLFTFNLSIDVFLVDDSSTDGTCQLVALMFPKVEIIHGSGDLYWNRGMHLAWSIASRNDYAFYLWLNDDVILYENCFAELLECSRIHDHKAVITGIVESHDKNEILYGGSDKNKILLQPNGFAQTVINMNGNVVLVPRSVYKTLGNLDPIFHHDLGDVDYGWRAHKNGISVVTTRRAVGSGERNKFCRVRLWNSNLVNRLKKLYSPLGNHPVINFYLRRAHFGVLNAAFYYIYIHIINIMNDNLIVLFFGEKYKDLA